MLLKGEIDPRLFPNRAAPSPEIKELGERFQIELNDITDPNALGPQSMSVIMKDGREFHADCADPYGAPTNPMKRAAREAKVKKCFEVGGYTGDPQKLIDITESLTTLSDIRDMFATVCD